MSSSAIDLPTKFAYQLLKLSFEGGTYTITDWTSDIAGDDGFTYASVPSMEVALPANNGILNNDDSAMVKVRLPADAFLTMLSSGLPHAPIKITIRELTKPIVTGDLASSHTTFVGRLMRTTRNPLGRSGEVVLSGMSAKGRLGVALGIPCNPTCDNTLGDSRCKVDVPWSNATVLAITGKELTLSVFATVADRFWHRGFLTLNGLNLLVREWRLADPTKFYMTRQAPTAWLSANVIVKAGCDKSKQTCIARFNNENNFNGLGIAIPAYHPLLTEE